MMSHIKTHPKFLEENHCHRKNNENLMDHEDFAISYLFKQSTGFPMVATQLIGENFNTLKMPYDTNLISIHLVKFTRQYKELRNYFSHMTSVRSRY